ncbi:MAG: hypothetical protein QGH51_02155 [Planctomycetota bacterium]|jgi:hypothetical protein|nr:hypothetical protein [Planctomycetota bacterium]MDP6940805.1 hypothetical protein [Planctomycetota bacterium]
MSESASPPSGDTKSAPPKSFTDILKALVGQIVTISNPESYEEAMAGHRLAADFYKSKVLQVTPEYIVTVTEFKHTKGKVPKEPAKQFIPIHAIKRVSVMKSEKIIHI